MSGYEFHIYSWIYRATAACALVFSIYLAYTKNSTVSRWMSVLFLGLPGGMKPIFLKHPEPLLNRKSFVRKQHQIFSTQGFFIILGSIFPVIGNVMYLGNVNPIPYMDWTPVAFWLSMFCLTIGITRFLLFDLIGKRVSEMVFDMKEYCEHIQDQLIAGNEIHDEIQIGRRWLEIRTKPFLNRRGRMAGHRIILDETTKRKEAGINGWEMRSRKESQDRKVFPILF